MKDGRALEVVIAAGDRKVREEMLRGAEANNRVHIAALCASGDEVRIALGSRPINVLILDVELPESGGFSLLRSLNSATPPAVIFTASSDEQALAAFQFHPLDYILHPVDPQHLATALRRAVERFGGIPGDAGAVDVLAQTGARTLQHRHLMVKSAGKILFLRTEEIDWIQADRDYVRIHNGARKHHLRGTISGMEQQLQDERFVRIHRSTIVNVDRIREMQPLSYGEYAVILHDGTRLTLSRSFRERVFSLLMIAA
jgi:two-component system LytT family response regulator